MFSGFRSTYFQRFILADAAEVKSPGMGKPSYPLCLSDFLWFWHGTMASQQEYSLANRYSILPSAASAWSTQLAAVAMTIKAARRAHDWDGLITIWCFCQVERQKE